MLTSQSAASRWRRRILLLSMMSFCAGCEEEPSLGRVRGRVTLDGAPLPQASVMFVPLEGGRPGTGRTDGDGRYELQFSGSRDGAIVGRHEVMISTFVPEQQTFDETGENVVVIAETPEKLPARYNRRTELSAVVESGPATYDFDLHSDAHDAAAPSRSRRRTLEIDGPGGVRSGD